MRRESTTKLKHHTQIQIVVRRNGKKLSQKVGNDLALMKFNIVGLRN